MEWPKLKNIILILLLFTNVCLLVLVGGPAVESYELQRANRQEAIQFLAENGVGLSEDVVPDRMELTAQVVVRDLEMERELAAALLGAGVTEEARGGEVYRFESENGSIQFHSDGTFSAQLRPEAFPVGVDPQQAGFALLETLGFEGEVREQSGNQITVRQHWEGSPLFQQQVTVQWNDTGITGLVNGSRLTGTPAQAGGRETISVATALITFLNGLDELGDVYSGIHSITQGYASSTALSGPMELTPVWRIVTDTGVYQLDTVSGELSRVSEKGAQ